MGVEIRWTAKVERTRVERRNMHVKRGASGHPATLLFSKMADFFQLRRDPRLPPAPKRPRPDDGDEGDAALRERVAAMIWEVVVTQVMCSDNHAPAGPDDDRPQPAA